MLAAISLPPLTADANRHEPTARHPGRPVAAPNAAVTASNANRQARPDGRTGSRPARRPVPRKLRPAPGHEPRTGGPSPAPSYKGLPAAPPPAAPRTRRRTPRRAPRRPSLPHPAARPARTRAAAHDSPGTGHSEPRHEDLPAPARLADMTLIPRPERHRPGARRAVRTREHHITAGRRIRIDRQRTRPYDGHGRHTASDPFSRSAQNEARRDPSRFKRRRQNPGPPAAARQQHHQRARPGTRP